MYRIKVWKRGSVRHSRHLGEIALSFVTQFLFKLYLKADKHYAVY